MKRYFLLVALLSGQCFAQVPVTPIVQPRVTFVNGAGAPCAGCTLDTYAAGTTTRLATYTDATGTSQNTNPIVLDAAGGANIWLGANSYKLILKDASGATIWSVDRINSGSLLPCATASAIQTANSAVNGLNCDPSITINTVTHTINIGNLPANHVTIGALGTPTSWTLDTTSPATALASLGGGNIANGTAGQILYYPATGNHIQGSSTIPDGISVITRPPSSFDGYPASTLYVAKPGGINPDSVQIASGVVMTDNQGTGPKVQHSTGPTTPGNCAKFDASGNTVDAGAACAAATPRTCNANGCYRIESDGTIQEWGVSSSVPTGSDANTVTVTFPYPFTSTANLSYVAWADSCATTPCDTANKNPLTISGNGSGVSTTGVVNFIAGVVPTGGGGTSLGSTIHIHWHALGN
jgi:hypothetical protein